MPTNRISLLVLVLGSMFLMNNCGTTNTAVTADDKYLQRLEVSPGVDPDFRAKEGFPIHYGERFSDRAAMNKFLYAFKNTPTPRSIPKVEVSEEEIKHIDRSHTTMWVAFHTGYTSWLDGFGCKWGLACGSKADFTEEEKDNWFLKVKNQCCQRVGVETCRGWYFESFDTQYTCVVCRER